ncbi:MAG: hypothetical protein M3N95_16995 [Actinomycetota bacterium]|nr:hypothetical protein [Actinomycetota bacterium]
MSAETNIVRDADAIPFANEKSTVYGNGAQFDQVGNDVLPTSIRMLAHWGSPGDHVILERDAAAECDDYLEEPQQ